MQLYNDNILYTLKFLIDVIIGTLFPSFFISNFLTSDKLYLVYIEWDESRPVVWSSAGFSQILTASVAV